MSIAEKIEDNAYDMIDVDYRDFFTRISEGLKLIQEKLGLQEEPDNGK